MKTILFTILFLVNFGLAATSLGQMISQEEIDRVVDKNIEASRPTPGAPPAVVNPKGEASPNAVQSSMDETENTSGGQSDTNSSVNGSSSYDYCSDLEARQAAINEWLQNYEMAAMNEDMLSMAFSEVSEEANSCTQMAQEIYGNQWTDDDVESACPGIYDRHEAAFNAWNDAYQALNQLAGQLTSMHNELDAINSELETQCSQIDMPAEPEWVPTPEPEQDWEPAEPDTYPSPYP